MRTNNSKPIQLEVLEDLAKMLTELDLKSEIEANGLEKTLSAFRGLQGIAKKILKRGKES